MVGSCQKLFLLITMSVFITTSSRVLTQHSGFCLLKQSFPRPSQSSPLFNLPARNVYLYIHLTTQTSGHYQNPLFHLKEDNLQSWHTSNCICLDLFAISFPMLSKAQQPLSLLPKVTSPLGTILGESSTSNSVLHGEIISCSDYNGAGLLTVMVPLTRLTQFLAFFQQCLSELKKKYMTEGSVDESS